MVEKIEAAEVAGLEVMGLKVYTLSGDRGLESAGDWKKYMNGIECRWIEFGCTFWL